MSHTNETPNYHLPQFVGTDIINPLVDTNGAYSDIDTALKDIADAEVADAGAIDALEATVGDNTAGLVKDVADLQAQNGNSVLTTDAQTLSGAINEVDAHTDTNTQNISTNAGNITDLQNTVGNVNSGLVKQVNDIDTLVSTEYLISDNVALSVTADGVKSYGTLLSELHNALTTAIGNLTAHQIIDVSEIEIPSNGVYLAMKRTYKYKNGDTAASIDFAAVYPDRTNQMFKADSARLHPSNPYFCRMTFYGDGTANAWSNLVDNIPNAGETLKLYYNLLVQKES